MQSSMYEYYFSMQEDNRRRSFNWGIQHKHRCEILGMNFIPYNWSSQEVIELILQNHPSVSYHLIKLIELYFERYIFSNDTIVVLRCLIPVTGFYK